MRRVSLKARVLAIAAATVATAAISMPMVSSAAAPKYTQAVQMPSGKENTTVVVQNTGTANATIALDMYTPGGVLIPAATQVRSNVAPGGAVRFEQATNSGLVPGFRGVGTVSSDQPVNALIVRDILDSAGNKSYSIASASATGGHRLAVPIAFNELVTAQWNSRIAVVNTGTAVACVKATYFLIPNVGGSATTNQVVEDNPTGQTGCPNGYSIPVGGQITFGRTGQNVVNFPAATNNNQMAVSFEVLNPGANAISANVDLYRSDGNRLLGSYEGEVVDTGAPASDDVGTDVVIPLAIKSPSGYYTVTGVLNTTGTPTNVTVQYVGVDGSGNAVNRSVQLNNVTNAAFHSVYQSDDIPVGFVGYARVTADQPVAAILVRGKQTVAFSGVNEATYTSARGVPTDQAATSWNLPLIFRRFAPVPELGYVGYNSWIQVQVADGGTAQVTLRFVGDPASGCSNGPFQATYTVTGSKVFYMNSDSSTENGFAAGQAPSCFFGGAQVTADKPVIAISNVTADKFPGSDSDGIYNGFK